MLVTLRRHLPRLTRLSSRVCIALLHIRLSLASPSHAHVSLDGSLSIVLSVVEVGAVVALHIVLVDLVVEHHGRLVDPHWRLPKSNTRDIERDEVDSWRDEDLAIFKRVQVLQQWVFINQSVGAVCAEGGHQSVVLLIWCSCKRRWRGALLWLLDLHEFPGAVQPDEAGGRRLVLLAVVQKRPVGILDQGCLPERTRSAVGGTRSGPRPRPRTWASSRKRCCAGRRRRWWNSSFFDYRLLASLE